MNSCKFSENCVPIWPAVQELWPKMCPCKERFFCCMLSFVGSTVFECEQTVRNLSYYGNTRKCAEFLLQVQKIRFLSHVVQKSPKNHVKKPRIGLHGGGRSPPPCSRTFASTLVTLQICGLIIVVDVDLVTLASLSRVKKSGRIQY